MAAVSSMQTALSEELAVRDVRLNAWLSFRQV